MATRSRQEWNLDAQGQYARQIGWKQNAQGRCVQHKFRLGADLNEARRREQRLRELWERIEATSRNVKPLWDELSLEIGRQIAKGTNPVVLAPLPGELDHEYAGRIRRAEMRFPTIRIMPSDAAKYAAATGRTTYTRADVLVWPPSPREEYERMLAGRQPVMLVHTDRIASQREAREPGAIPGPPTLHQAMRDYIAWIKEHYFRPDQGQISDTGRTKIKQVETLLGRHDDAPLSQLSFEAVEQLVCYWRRRPLKKGTTEPISRVSAENYIGELKRFFKWLHRATKYTWRKPEDFDGINTNVDSDPAGARRRLEQARVFSLDELVLLNQYATPLDRVFLLLGLNCGFGIAEIASLAVGEVVLFQAHSPRDQELLHFRTTDRDSFIKRVRHKSGVYGEFLLFPQTVQAMQWTLERRRQQSGFQADAPLLLNGRGERYDKPTRNDNRSQQILNQFDRLHRRVRSDGHELSNLSFGKLRKTAADLVRRFSDGEVSGVFLCHGQPVRTDDLADVYTNRPFGKVFAAIRQVEEHLKPVFEAAGSDPFAADVRT